MGKLILRIFARLWFPSKGTRISYVVVSILKNRKTSGFDFIFLKVVSLSKGSG